MDHILHVIVFMAVSRWMYKARGCLVDADRDYQLLKTR